MVKYILPNDWDVYIGEDLFNVEGKNHQEARFKAADMFRTKYKLPESIPLTDIAQSAHPRKPYRPDISTSTLVKFLKLKYKEKNGRQV